ncbi:unnamed protein product [Protopolystoma xenopodis]|uniref:Uncharacterized protein n=1 Tax=Protopolystoma xenopodis TaxID=117903 RepID=A0A448WEE0_9PLAT|nr:unnamed protein product [Protopolystoma xenopodis]
MTRLTDDADYDACETSGNVSRPRSDFGNDHACNGLRTRCVLLRLPTNMTKLRKQCQTTSISDDVGSMHNNCQIRTVDLVHSI